MLFENRPVMAAVDTNNHNGSGYLYIAVVCAGGAAEPYQQNGEASMTDYKQAFGNRNREFLVYKNFGDDGYHITAADDNGGMIIADHIQHREWAMLIADMLNAQAACLSPSTT
jgi:hypothetical protein